MRSSFRIVRTMMVLRALKNKFEKRSRDNRRAMAKHRHPWLRRLVGAGIVAGIAYAVWRVTANEPEPFDDGREPVAPSRRGVEDEAAAVQEVAPVSTTTDAWVDARDGACPASHPVKGKLSSGIYHVPGGANYDRTTPDRCYVDEDAAEADGLRAAKN